MNMFDSIFVADLSAHIFLVLIFIKFLNLENCFICYDLR